MTEQENSNEFLKATLDLICFGTSAVLISDSGCRHIPLPELKAVTGNNHTKDKAYE